MQCSAVRYNDVMCTEYGNVSRGLPITANVCVDNRKSHCSYQFETCFFYIMLSYVMLLCFMLCHAVLCYLLLCCIILRYAVSFDIIICHIIEVHKHHGMTCCLPIMLFCGALKKGFKCATYDNPNTITAVI